MLTGLVCFAAMLGAAALRAEDKKPAENAVYACPGCHVAALEPGKCPKCERPMKAVHVLGTKGGEITMCRCGASCGCKAEEAKDGKCGCGKATGTASAKGLYVCPDGCPHLAAASGKCPCGKEMTKVE